MNEEITFEIFLTCTNKCIKSQWIHNIDSSDKPSNDYY